MTGGVGDWWGWRGWGGWVTGGGEWVLVAGLVDWWGWVTGGGG